MRLPQPWAEIKRLIKRTKRWERKCNTRNFSARGLGNENQWFHHLFIQTTFRYQNPVIPKSYLKDPHVAGTCSKETSNYVLLYVQVFFDELFESGTWKANCTLHLYITTISVKQAPLNQNSDKLTGFSDGFWRNMEPTGPNYQRLERPGTELSESTACSHHVGDSY